MAAGRQKWSPEEIVELKDLFGWYLKNKQCPSKKDTLQKCKVSRKNKGFIYKRNLENIKKKVWYIYNKP